MTDRKVTVSEADLRVVMGYVEDDNLSAGVWAR